MMNGTGIDDDMEVPQHVGDLCGIDEVQPGDIIAKLVPYSPRPGSLHAYHLAVIEDMEVYGHIVTMHVIHRVPSSDGGKIIRGIFKFWENQLPRKMIGVTAGPIGTLKIADSNRNITLMKAQQWIDTSNKSWTRSCVDFSYGVLCGVAPDDVMATKEFCRMCFPPEEGILLPENVGDVWALDDLQPGDIIAVPVRSNVELESKAYHFAVVESVEMHEDTFNLNIIHRVPSYNNGKIVRGVFTVENQIPRKMIGKVNSVLRTIDIAKHHRKITLGKAQQWVDIRNDNLSRSCIDFIYNILSVDVPEDVFITKEFCRVCFPPDLVLMT